MRQVIGRSKRLGAGFMLLLLVACGGKLTQASFETVNEGMSAEEVKSILGQPTQTSTATLPLIGTVTTYTYKTEKSEVTVIFRDDKVKSKSGTVSD